MQSRENRRSIIVRNLEKIKGYNQKHDPKKPIAFENVTYFFKNARNIGFAADAYIQYVEIEGAEAAIKIIKLSEAESNPENFHNTSDINKLGTEPIIMPRSSGFNIWREVSAMEMTSPENSGLEHFPYFYGFFITKWADNMIKDMYMYDKDKSKKYKEYLKSREENEICIILVMELFDYDLVKWTDRRHSFQEWKDIYSQMLQSLIDLHSLFIIHNDSHYKNFLIKKHESGWLVVLADMGSCISTKHDLDAKEKALYKKLHNTNKDPILMLQTFDRFNLAVYHFGKLKRNQTIAEIKDRHPDLLPEIKKQVKKPYEHTLFWIALAEVMANNMDHFGDLIDIDKLPPLLINEILDKEFVKIRWIQLIQVNNTSLKPYSGFDSGAGAAFDELDALDSSFFGV